MSFLTGLFKKKKIDVDDHEMVWRRDGGSDFPSFRRESNGSGGASGIQPSENREFVSHNPYHREENTSFQDYRPSQDPNPVPSDYGSPEESVTHKATSAIAMPPWAVNLNEHRDIRSPYVDITPMNPEKPYALRKRLNNRLNSQPLDFYDEGPPSYSERDLQPAFDEFPSPSLTASEGPERGRASSWVRNARQNDMSAKNKEFYEIEARINRKMLEEEHSAKGPAVRTDIFNPEAVADKPAIHSFNVYQRVTREAPVKVAANNFAVFGTEITARTAFDRRKIFEVTAEPGAETGKAKKEIRQMDVFSAKPADLQNIRVLEDALNSEKTVDELLQDLNARQRELNAAEQRYFQAVKDPRNLTVLETDLRDMLAQIEREKARGRTLALETKKANEEMALSNQRLNQKSLQVDQMRATLPPSLGDRENTLREIEMLQGKIKREKEALGGYGESLQAKMKAWREQSERAKNAELESTKMNVDNFTDDLLKELAYFDGRHRRN